MTTKPNEPEALKPMPCPFCAASFRHVSDKDGEFWMHSGVVTDDDCFMSGQGIFPRQLSAWNRRAHAQPVADDGGVAQADREAAAKCVEHGLSRPNPLNVRQGVVDSWHLVQAFAAHRLQSVAAATAKLRDRIDELTNEAEIFAADHADQNRMVDRIADLIGLPHDQELDTVAFELWISAQTAATAAKDAEIMKRLSAARDKMEVASKNEGLGEDQIANIWGVMSGIDAAISIIQQASTLSEAREAGDSLSAEDRV
jgi:hypothetical protein